MALQPFTIENFGGLNLASDPLEVGATMATDMLNVDVDLRGRIQTRPGYAKFTGSALAGTVASIAAVPWSGTPLTAAWANGIYYLLNTSGTTTGDGSSYNPGPNGAVPMWLSGDLALTGIYATTGLAAGWIIAHVSGNWTAIDLTASVEISDFWTVIGRSPKSHRIVLSGGTLSPGRVVFSDPGGGAWTINNWVDPFFGTGERVTSIANFADNMYVFTPGRFAVFTGESVDTDGGPLFNYYTVDSGVGCVARFGTAVGPDGVYFVGRDGVYLTNGNRPSKISGALDPLFRGAPSADYSGGSVSQQYLPNACAAFYRERLYVAVTTGASTTNNRMLVYDPKLDVWTVWDLAARCMAVQTSTAGNQELFFGYTSGSNDIGRHFRSYTDDAGSAIGWSYKSGRYSLSDPGRVTTTDYSSISGSGTVTLRLDSDLYTDQTGSATLGTAPAVTEGWPPLVDQEGTWLQYTLSGTGPASVSRLTHYLSSAEPVGVR